MRRHPLLTYFAITFAISWGGVVAVVGVDGFPGSTDRFAALLAPVVAAMLLGPSVAGVVATGLVRGRVGLRELRARLLNWRVGIPAYVVALLTAPLLVSSTLLALSLHAPAFVPGIASAPRPASHLAVGIVTGLAAGMFEELGWTGFAVPELRRRFGIVSTGLLLGLVWGAWHFLVTWWGSGATIGDLPLSVYMPALLFSFLPPYRVLMVWLHDRTGSLLLAMLMHASLTASVRIFDPLGIAGRDLALYNVVLGVALWGMVGIVTVLARRRRLAATS